MVVLALATLVGCQGVSSSNSSAPQSPSPSGGLTLNSSALDFGSVVMGGNKTLTITATNSGNTSVTVTGATSSAPEFSCSGPGLPVTIAAGQNAILSITFTPDATANASGTLSISSTASNPTLNLSLSGAGLAPGSLTVTPSSLSFGSVQAGSSQQHSATLANTGGTNVTISQDTVTGSGFSVGGFSPPVTLTPGQSYTFSVIFAPQSAGSASGNLALVSNASNPTLSIPLSATGTAAGQLTVSPTTLNFSNVVEGTNSVLQGTLNATGASVTVTSASSSNSEFTLSGLSLPATIPAGNTAAFSVTFTPQATGAASATLTFASNASNPPTQQSLTGNGTAPPQHSAALSWTASTSSNIVSYNIYRGTSPGSYSKIASVPAPSTTYTDSSVTDGQTYYYATTAVDSSSQESTYSNQATAVIPPP